jgi:hypothetical protein
MSINSTNLDKITKLLRKTGSDNDHEALASIRKVNEILTKNNSKDWGAFLGSLTVTVVKTKTVYVEVEKKPEPKPKYDYSDPIDHDEIQEIFDFIYGNGLESDFVDSLNSQYHKRLSLSKKQIDILRKIYNSKNINLLFR